VAARAPLSTDKWDRRQTHPAINPRPRPVTRVKDRILAAFWSSPVRRLGHMTHAPWADTLGRAGVTGPGGPHMFRLSRTADAAPFRDNRNTARSLCWCEGGTGAGRPCHADKPWVWPSRLSALGRLVLREKIAVERLLNAPRIELD